MIGTTRVAGARWARPRARVWWGLIGPAFVVSVGYMDPGNWATDLGAATFGYRLLWVIALANVIAIGLQLAVSNLALVTGSDLATLIALRWRGSRFLFWAIFQATAMATDVAEFGGVILGAQMLFHCSVAVAVGMGMVVVCIVFLWADRRSRVLELGMIVAVGAVALAFLYQIPVLHPVWSAVFRGAVTPSIPSPGALVLVVGIIGATVMPHNLFLHSALIVNHTKNSPESQRRREGRFFTKETLIALSAAAIINAGILIIGATVHGSGGSIDGVFSSLLTVRADTAVAFGAALLISGIAALVSATLCGDYIFAAFSSVRVPATLRRGITIVPSALAILMGVSIPNLLIWSQVALALALPVVLVPLAVLMIAERKRVCAGSRAQT